MFWYVWKTVTQGNCPGRCPRKLPVAWEQWASETNKKRACNKSSPWAFLLPPPVLLSSVFSKAGLASLPSCLHQHLFPLQRSWWQSQYRLSSLTCTRDTDSWTAPCLHSRYSQLILHTVASDLSKRHIWPHYFSVYHHHIRMKFNSRHITIWILSSSIFSPLLCPKLSPFQPHGTYFNAPNTPGSLSPVHLEHQLITWPSFTQSQASLLYPFFQEKPSLLPPGLGWLLLHLALLPHGLPVPAPTP